MKHFYTLLINALIVTFTNNYIWFAFTFWLFLNAGSVVATSFLSGIFLVLTSICGFWFGHLVDKYNKKNVASSG